MFLVDEVNELWRSLFRGSDYSLGKVGVVSDELNNLDELGKLGGTMLRSSKVLNFQNNGPSASHSGVA